MSKEVQHFGKYRVLRRLAGGGMGEVHLAAHEGLEGFNRTVVVKSVLPALEDHGEMVELFLDEARLCAQLTHPNIVHVYDFGREGDRFYMVMEYIEGTSLADLIRRKLKASQMLSTPFVAAVGSQVCAALDYAHNKNDADGNPLHIIHRDVSPQNVVVTSDGVVKLLDFGIAKAERRQTQTRVGSVRGKPSYMSPEQTRGDPIDGRSDLFSVGIVLWESLAGRRLFFARNPIELAAIVCDEPAVPVSEFAPDVPEEMASVVEKALEREVSRRFQSASELGRALDGLLYRLGAPNAVAVIKAELAGDPAQALVSPGGFDGYRGFTPDPVPAWIRDLGDAPAAQENVPNWDAPAEGGRPTRKTDLSVRAVPPEIASSLKVPDPPAPALPEPLAAPPVPPVLVPTPSPVAPLPAPVDPWPPVAPPRQAPPPLPAAGTATGPIFQPIAQPISQPSIPPFDPFPRPAPSSAPQPTSPAPKPVERLELLFEPPRPAPAAPPRRSPSRPVRPVPRRTRSSLWMLLLVVAAAAAAWQWLPREWIPREWLSREWIPREWILGAWRSLGPVDGGTQAPVTGLPERVSVEMASTPPGARILVDGQETNLLTPAAVALVSGRSYDVAFRHPDCFEHVARVAVVTRKTSPLAVTLRKGAIVSVTATPSDAEVFLDGGLASRAPARLGPLEPGRHAVDVRAKGYLPESREVVVKGVERTAVHVALRRGATLTVTSVPSDAKVVLDGVDTGSRTPATLAVSAGTPHGVLVRKEGFADRSRRVLPIAGGEVQSVEIELDTRQFRAQRDRLRARVTASEADLAACERQVASLARQQSEFVRDIAREEKLQQMLADARSRCESLRADAAAAQSELDDLAEGEGR